MKKILSSLLLLFIFFVGLAQIPARFLTYNVKDGLSQSSVHSLHRDKDGLLWVGTQDGLNSFNGKEFTSYRYNERDSSSISDQFILKILEDSKGNLWVGTRNGLNYFNKYSRQFKRFYINEKEKHEFQSSYDKIFLFNDDSLLIQKEYLFLLEPKSGKFSKINSPEGKPGSWIISNAKTIWFIDKQNQVFIAEDWRKNKFKKLGTSPIPFSESSYYYYSPADSIVYISSYDDRKLLYELDAKTFTIKNKLLAPAAINQVLLTNKKTLLVSTTNGLLSKENKATPKFTQANLTQNGLPPGSILTSFVDKDENLWVGTAGNGFSVTNKYFNYHQLINFPIANDRVYGFSYNNNNLYLAGLSGLYKIKNFSVSDPTKKISPVISGKAITGVTSDAAGNTWVSINQEEILVLDKNDKVIKRYPFLSKEKDLNILKMSNAKNGTIFICTSRGLYIKEPNNEMFTVFNDRSEYKLLGNYVLSVYEDYKGNFWVANNNGLNILSPELKPLYSIKSDNDNESFIKRTIVTSVTQDLDSAYWIGTLRNGLYRLKNDSVNHFTNTNGLASDVIYNVVCDVKNRIWVTSSAGLNVYNSKENIFNTLSEFEGVPSAAFSFAGVLNFGNHILYGTSEGLLICDAEKVELKNNDIEAYISDIKINGESTGIQNKNLSIMPDNKLISFELAYTPALLSGNIIYQYRIKEINEDWINLAPGVSNISYNGLPYKNLEMQVRAAVNINKLNDAKIYSVVIKSYPPIYKTGIFIGVLALLFALLILLIVINYNKRKYKQQLQIIEVERTLHKERTRIGRDLHDNMGAYTSALLAGLNRIENKDEKQNKLLADLKVYGASIMGFLRETIWMLNAEKLTVTAFADRFKNYAIRICKNYPELEIKFDEKIDFDKSLPPTIMLNLFRILQEALQNACKHAQASIITISILSKENLVFSIQDDGIGFIEKKLKDHYGLDNMKQRAEEAGFSLDFKSNKNGTLITLTENTANG